MEYFKGTVGKASSHSDVVAVRPIISLDGTVIVERGQFRI
jgi:hypothetical protein